MAISKVILPHFPLPCSRSSGQDVLTWETDSSVDGASEITFNGMCNIIEISKQYLL